MSTDLERELERTVVLSGFRYGLHDFAAHVGGAEALKHHNDNTEAPILKRACLTGRPKNCWS
jgi:hypothetical protein